MYVTESVETIVFKSVHPNKPLKLALKREKPKTNIAVQIHTTKQEKLINRKLDDAMYSASELGLFVHDNSFIFHFSEAYFIYPCLL